MKRLAILLLAILVGFSLSAQERGNTKIQSFPEAKKILAKLYQNHRVTFYCGCSYDKKVDHSSCGYQPRKPLNKSGRKNERAYRIEWEHIVPAHAFGQSFREWREGDPKCVNKNGKPFKGRKCAETNQLFARMEADLYNLVPAIGEVNGNRSNYSMAMIPGEVRRYGACDVEIEGRKIEPRPAIRGDIARIYRYMDAAYPGHGVISRKNRKLFEAWDKSDPVDEWECERARMIEKVQGNQNTFVKRKCNR
ncbi:endonuclease [bacterium]|nr:endonuclease [bacterium]